MIMQVSLSEGIGRRGYWRARGRVVLGAALGITAGLALLDAQPVRAAAPSCQETPLPSALAAQFKDIAPGVPYQAGDMPIKQRPQGKASILGAVEDQMGFIRGVGRTYTLHAINRIRYGGCGEIVEDGHTYEVTQYAYGVSLHQDAAREDIQAEGPEGRVRLIRVVRGNEAWDESTPGVGTHSADRLAKQWQLQLARTPFGIVNALIAMDAAQIKVQDTGSGAVTLQLTLDGVPTAVVLDQNYRPMKVTQRVDHHLIVAQYTDYHDLAGYGVMIPRHIEETVDGHPHMALHIVAAENAEYEQFQPPAFEAAVAPPAQSDYLEFGHLANARAAAGDDGATPRLADGHPDLNGFWGDRGPGGFGRASNSGSDELEVMASRNGIFNNAEGDAYLIQQSGDNIPFYKVQYWSQIRDNEHVAGTQDPYINCLPVTPPRLGPPDRIVQLPHDVLFFQTAGVGTQTTRDIPVGPMAYPPDPDGTWLGDPSAHWDGDTLVVETVGYNDQSWLSRAGYTHGYNLKTVERLHRQGNALTYAVTVEDPEYLQRPWVLPTQQVHLLPGGITVSPPPCQWLGVPGRPQVIGTTLG